jgi:predicted unusual protein kinase regulating ubiquinone biosynthesis (AarF/ABC1/UbiB family)
MVKRKGKSRAGSMIRLGAGLAGNFLAYQMQRPFSNAETDARRKDEMHRKSARQVREELQNLRGPMMKVGQALSMQVHELRPEWIAELSALQMQAPPMHYSLMRAQFKAGIGKYPEEVFKSFAEEPCAAASLGQVHWAVTKEGEEVAVKIQYPAVREAVAEDFQFLRKAGLPIRLTGHLSEKIIAEAERGILEETDYRNEARNIEYFREKLAPLGFVRVPRVYKHLSGDRVLTMSRVPGQRMQEFLNDHPKQSLRDQLGEGLCRLFFYQVFQLRALHADPHPGNYLFNKDGSISLVDFGCVKYLKKEAADCYALMWGRQWPTRPDIYAVIVRTMLGRESANDPEVRRIMEGIRNFYDEFHNVEKPGYVCDAGDPRFMDGLAELSKILLQNKFLSPDLLFVSRTEGGMCNLLHLLKARVRTTTIVKELLPVVEVRK